MWLGVICESHFVGGLCQNQTFKNCSLQNPVSFWVFCSTYSFKGQIGKKKTLERSMTKNKQANKQTNKQTSKQTNNHKNKKQKKNTNKKNKNKQNKTKQNNKKQNWKSLDSIAFMLNSPDQVPKSATFPKWAMLCRIRQYDFLKLFRIQQP